MVKIAFSIMLLTFLACGTRKPAADNSPDTDMVEQEAIVEAHVISRGRFQYILVVGTGPHAGKYLPEKELPAAYCRDEMAVMIDGQIMDEKGVVYKPGPTDIPEKDFEIPMIRVDKIVERNNDR